MRPCAPESHDFSALAGGICLAFVLHGAGRRHEPVARAADAGAAGAGHGPMHRRSIAAALALSVLAASAAQATVVGGTITGTIDGNTFDTYGIFGAPGGQPLGPTAHRRLQLRHHAGFISAATRLGRLGRHRRPVAQRDDRRRHGGDGTTALPVRPDRFGRRIDRGAGPATPPCQPVPVTATPVAAIHWSSQATGSAGIGAAPVIGVASQAGGI